MLRVAAGLFSVRLRHSRGRVKPHHAVRSFYGEEDGCEGQGEDGEEEVREEEARQAELTVAPARPNKRREGSARRAAAAGGERAKNAAKALGPVAIARGGGS